MNAITLSEVGPRDGLQSIAAMVPTETKVALVRASYEAGVRRMEIGSFVSPKAIPQMSDTPEVLKAAKQLAGLECTTLVPNRRGFEGAVNAGADRLGLFMSCTEGHNKANVNRSRAESLADLTQIIRDTPKGVKIRFNLSTSFHCPFDGVVPVQDCLDFVERIVAIDPEMEIAICDTTGNAAPNQVRAVFSAAINTWGPRFAFHGHDTYGMGCANVYAAYEAGVRVFDAASGGIGGCPFAPGATGNVAMEDVVWMFHRMGVDTGVDWDGLLLAADLAAGVEGATPGGRMRGVPAARPKA